MIAPAMHSCGRRIDVRPTDGSMAVLDVTEWYGESSGGIRTYLDAKATYIGKRADLRHVMVVPGERDSLEIQGSVSRYRLRGPRVPRHGPYRMMLATRTLSAIVRHERPDLIEVGSAFLVPWLIAPLARRANVPVVCFHHTNVTGLVDRTVPGGKYVRSAARSATQSYLRKLNELADVTVVASRPAREELEAAGVSRLVEIPLGVDTDLFTPVLRDGREAIRSHWQLPSAPLAGFIGRFAAEKDLFTVMNAWPAVERATGARLVLIGAGPQETRLREHPYAKHVTFLPFQTSRSSVAALIAALDMVVTPGPLETFGLAALESLSCGTPVLAADCGGVAELVRASGAGRLFQARNADALAASAIALLSAEHRVMQQQGRAFAVERHAWPTVLDRLFDVYRKLLR